MSTDGEPPTVAGSPDIVRRCADCGETLPVGGHRFVHPDVPYEPLCVEDYAIAVRCSGRFSPSLWEVGPPSYTDEEGKLWVRRDCPRCGGSGKVEPFRGTCFTCFGRGWAYVSPLDVRRTMRWSATFQANRVPRPGVSE